MATSGDLELAISGDFSMATDSALLQIHQMITDAVPATDEFQRDPGRGQLAPPRGARFQNSALPAGPGLLRATGFPLLDEDGDPGRRTGQIGGRGRQGASGCFQQHQATVGQTGDGVGLTGRPRVGRCLAPPLGLEIEQVAGVPTCPAPYSVTVSVSPARASSPG